MKKYKALRIIAQINIIMGVCAIIIGLVSLIMGIVDIFQYGYYWDNFKLNCIMLGWGLLWGIGLIGAGQLVYLLIDIEANTRTTAERLNSTATSTTDIKEEKE